MLAQADPRIRPEDARQEPTTLLERLVDERPAVEVEEVEDLVDERGRLGRRSPPLDPRLEQREIGLAVVVEGDDLAVDDRLRRRDPGRPSRNGPK